MKTLIFYWALLSYTLCWVISANAQQPDTLVMSKTSASNQNDPFINYSTIQPIRFADISKMAKSFDVATDKYTGAVNVEIPIYEIASEAVNIPVALTYRTTGIRVEDVASEVGLGWELSAGGKITRFMHGEPDNLEVLKIVDRDADTWNKEFFWKCVNEKWDTQPDMYSFDLPGGGGNFVFDLDGKPRTIPFQNYKIEFANDVFVIYDSEGTKYTFATKESTEEVTGDQSTKYVSAWYLDRIEYLNGTKVFYSYETGSNYNNKYINDLVQFAANLFNGKLYIANLAYQEATITTNIEICEPKYLTTIKFKDQEIKFKYDNNRDDCVGMRRLNEVEVKSGQNLCHRFKFKYGNFPDNSPKLMSIKDETHNNYIRQICSFEYYEDITLPAKNTSYKGFDHWGFYNTNTPSPLKFADFEQIFPYQVVTSIRTGTRYPILEYTRAQSLRKVVYPNGGFKEFIYELHKGANLKRKRSENAGGLRIYEIIEKASSLESPARTWFEYLDGVIYDDECNYVAEYGSIKDEDSFFLIFSSKSLSSPADFLGCSVIYSSVVEHLPNGSSIKYDYVPLSDYPDLSPQHFIMENDDIGRRIEIGPRAPKTSRSWGRNLLQSKEWISEGKTVRKENYTYNIDTSKAVKIPFRTLNSDGRYYQSMGYWVSRRYPFIDKNYHISCPVLPIKKVVVKGSDVLPSQTTYEYNERYVPIKMIERECDGSRNTKMSKYPCDYPEQKTDSWLVKMDQRNAIVPIETITYRNGKVVDASINQYKMNPLNESSIVLSDKFGLIYQQKLDSVDLAVSKIAFGKLWFDRTKYETKQTFDEYDEDGNLLCQHAKNGIYQSVIYDINNSSPIAFVDNARHSVRMEGRNTQVFFNDFESGGIAYAKAKSGYRVGNNFSSYVIDLSHFMTGSYVLSYWYKNFDTSRWLRHTEEVTVTPQSSMYYVTIASDVLYIDDMSLLPKNAVMTSECSIAPLGKISQTDAQGRTTYYEYNKVGLPSRVYDNNRTLIQQYSYDNYGVDL